MRFFRNLAGIMLTTAANAPIGVLTSVLLARWLSPEDRGLYAVCLTFAMTLTIVVQLGWPSASIYRIRNANSPPGAVAATALVATLVLSVLAIVGAVSLEPMIESRFLRGAEPLAFYLILSSVPFRLLGNLFGSIARGIDRFSYENWYSLALNASSLVALGFALVLGEGALIEALWAVVVVHALTTSGFVLTVLRQTGLRVRLETSELAGSLRFGFKSYLLTMAARLHENQDIFVLAYLLAEPAQVAYFAIAKGAMRILELLPAALNKAAYPQLAGLPRAEAVVFAREMVRQGILFVVPASLALGMAAPLLLPAVYGESYTVSVAPFLLLLPCVLFISLDGVVGRFFSATDQHTPIVATRAVSAALNLALNFWWIPRYGIGGAAAAACASFGLQALLAVAVFQARTDTKIRDLFWLRRTDFAPYANQLAKLARRFGSRPE